GAVPEQMSAAQLREMTWIGFDDDHAYMPGQAWIRDLLGTKEKGSKRPMIRVNDWFVVQDALHTGAGISGLPCYRGDTDPRLARIGFERKGALLPAVTAEQYLLVHHDLRNLPRVRAVMDAIIRLFQQDKALLAGETPQQPAAEKPARRGTV